MVKHEISIYKGQQLEIIISAPADKYAARELWVFLVDSLQPGFIVELSNGPSEITRPSGSKVPLTLYKKLMDME